MHFSKVTFAVSTKLGEGSPVRTTNVTLGEHEVHDSIVAAALVSGQSPRVAYQNRWRKSGKIPTEVNMSWAEWIGRPPAIVGPIVLTPEEIQNAAKEHAQNNPEYRAKMIADLLAMDKPADEQT